MSADQPPPDNANDEIFQRYDRLFRFGMNSDMTVTCGEKSWQVHSAIICPRSTFSAGVCRDQSSAIESHHIHLQDKEPWAVDKMLRYLYILEYYTLPDDYAKFQFAADLNTDVHMYILAQKYGIDGLRIIAEEKYKRSLKAYLVGCQVVSLHQNVDFHPLCSDEYAETEFFAELLSTMRLIYHPDQESTRLLREHTVGVFRDILCRWSRCNRYENSMYAYLGAYLKRAYEALLGEFSKHSPVDFVVLGERLRSWGAEYVAIQEEWLREHRSAWGEDWEQWS